MRVEHDMTPLVKAWLKGTKESPFGAQETVKSVMARVPDVPQRRRLRWSWPLRRRSSTADSDPTTGGLVPAGGFAMFSALKFIVAGVIVALFGGFLIGGVLTSPSIDDTSPAVPSGSPPAITDGLLATLETEEVEPGVLRILSDGHRDFHAGILDIVADPDGSIWGLRKDRVYRLGQKGHLKRPADWPGWPVESLVLDGEGIPWLRSEGADGPGIIHSYEDGDWVLRKRAPKGGAIQDLVAAPDGAIWAAWTAPGGRATIARFDGQDWQPLEGQGPPVEHWQERPDLPWHPGLLIDPDGGLWVNPPAAGEFLNDHSSPLYRYVDGDWQRQDDPGVGKVAVGPSGTRWLSYREAEPANCGFNAMGPDCDYSLDSLAYFDGDKWNEMDQGVGASMDLNTDFETAPDGSLWTGLHPESGGGIGRFELGRQDRYLQDHFLYRFAIAPDGAVWTFDDTGIFVIPAEAPPTEED